MTIICVRSQCEYDRDGVCDLECLSGSEDWEVLNQCKDCPAVDGCGGMNGECPYSDKR